MIAEKQGGREAAARPGARPPAAEESASVSTDAEGGLRSEAGEIGEQARRSRTP